MLVNLRHKELNEEEYFHAVNSSFKKPLRCARYCDQLKYTKFDPDCSWQARGGPVSKTSPTPVYKRKTKTAKQDFHDCSVCMSDEEFLELCNAISKVGYAYAPKKSKSKTTRSCAFNRVTLSPQSNFTMLLLSVVLPVAPFVIPGALILAAVVFSSFVFLRIVMLTKAVLQKFLRLTAFMFSLGMFVKDFLFLHLLRLINNLFAVGMLVEKLLTRLSGNRARSVFATHVVRIRDHGSTIFGHRRKCLPIVIAKLLFKGHHKDLVEVAFKTFWNNEWACSTSGPEEEVLNLTHVSKLLQTFNAHVKIFSRSTRNARVEWSFLGHAPGSCVGYIWYDAERQHVYEIDGVNLEASATQCNYAGPLLNFHAGGKQPKAKCKAKATAARRWQPAQARSSGTSIERDPLPTPSVTPEGDLSRVELPVDLARCRARVWNSGLGYGAQCLAKP